MLASFQFSRRHIIYGAYALCVVVAFVWGRLNLDSDGVCFVPTMLLTMPWSIVVPSLPLPQAIFHGLTVVYDLPLFLGSTLLNVLLMEAFWRNFKSLN